MPVRVIDARVTVTIAAGQPAGLYGLVTTLLDDGRHPVGSLIELYHERRVRHEVAWNEWNSQKEDRFMSVT